MATRETNDHVHMTGVHASFRFKYRKVCKFSFRDTPEMVNPVRSSGGEAREPSSDWHAGCKHPGIQSVGKPPQAHTAHWYTAATS